MPALARTTEEHPTADHPALRRAKQQLSQQRAPQRTRLPDDARLQATLRPQLQRRPPVMRAARHGPCRQPADQAGGTSLPRQLPPDPVAHILLDLCADPRQPACYGHFILGILAPLVLHLTAKLSGTVYIVRSSFTMDRHLAALDLPGLRIVSAETWQSLRDQGQLPVRQLAGYDEPDRFDAHAFDRVRRSVIERLGLSLDSPATRPCLLLDPAAPPGQPCAGPTPAPTPADPAGTAPDLLRPAPDLPSAAPGLGARQHPTVLDRTSGPENASASCFDEQLHTTGEPVWPDGALAAAASAAYPDGTLAAAASAAGAALCLLNPQAAPLAGQVAALAGTRTLVARPGPALVNMLWMPPGGVVVEVGTRQNAADADRFRRMAFACGHAHVHAVAPGQGADLTRADIAGALRAARAIHHPVRAAVARGDAPPPPAIPVSRLSALGWRARFVASLARTGRPPDLVWLGDSITAQFERRGKQPWCDYRPVWDTFYAPRHAANFGISGDTTQNLLWRIENGQVDGIAPRLAIVLIGANNLPVPAWSAADTLRGIEAVVAALRCRLPNTSVLLLGVLPSLRGARVAERTAWLNVALAAAYAGDPLVTFQDMTGLFLTGGAVDPALFADTYATPPGPALHPSAPAQRRMAEAIEPVVRRLMGDG